jgi:Fe-S-cluster containining protein
MDEKIRSAPSDATGEAPPCLSCGTCCFSTLERYVPVSGDDYARLGEAAEALVGWVENRAYLRLESGHCAALDVNAAEGLFTCTVYDRRPGVCRELERGSPQCAGERDAKSERPGRALVAAAALARRGRRGGPAARDGRDGAGE